MLTNLNKLSLGSLRRSCLWFAFVAMSLTAQVSFIIHAIEHGSHTDSSIPVEDCFSCLFSSIEFDGLSNGAISKTFKIDNTRFVFHYLSLLGPSNYLAFIQPLASPDLSNI